jgi:hypothetical protein
MHDFGLWHGGFMVLVALGFAFSAYILPHLIKKLAEIICHTE